MNTKEALQFSIFPSLLLITTLFRLALNVSTTRNILAMHEAGDVVAELLVPSLLKAISLWDSSCF